MTRRRDLTRETLASLGLDQDLDQVMRSWYQNIRESGGFRLTATGHNTLQAQAVPAWTMTLPARGLTKKQLLQLDRTLQWPYYIDGRRRRLWLYSSRDAVMARLYGDVAAWLAGQAK